MGYIQLVKELNFPHSQEHILWNCKNQVRPSSPLRLIKESHLPSNLSLARPYQGPTSSAGSHGRQRRKIAFPAIPSVILAMHRSIHCTLPRPKLGLVPRGLSHLTELSHSLALASKCAVLFWQCYCCFSSHYYVRQRRMLYYWPRLFISILIGQD